MLSIFTHVILYETRVSLGYLWFHVLCVVSIGFYRRAGDSTTPFWELRAK